MTYPRELTNPAQANWPPILNDNGQAVAPAAMYGKKTLTTTGLVLGYFGGHIAGTLIADGTTTLAASEASVYVVAHRTTGAVTSATNTTNWNNTSVYGRIGVAVTGASSITTWTDWREQSGGWFDRTAAPGVGDALKADPLSQFAATTSAQLAGVISDETGSGALVFANTPTFVTPLLGTPTSGTLTNCTGLPVAGGGTGVATLAAHGVLVGNDTGAVAVTGTGTAGQVLTSNGAAADPTFQAAGGVSDGDKGDLTVTASGATWTIDNDVVTNAKAANMATATLKGRLTAGTGDPEDLTFNQARQLLNKKQVLTDGANIAVDADLGLNCRVVLGGNRTLDNPINLVDGDVLNVRIHQDGTGSRTLAYGSKYKFPSGTTPVLSTAASARDFMSCQYDSTDDTLSCVLNKAFA